MNVVSKRKQDTVKAFNEGFRMQNGDCYDRFGNIVTGSVKMCGKIPYKRFGNPNVLFHQLMAYQKFGDEWLYSNLDVRHVDGNSLNNDESNIELGTRRENKMDMPVDQRRELMYNMRTSDAWRCAVAKSIRKRCAKLTDAQVSEIREMLKTKIFLKDIAKMFNVSRSAINDIKMGKTYKTSDPNNL